MNNLNQVKPFVCLILLYPIIFFISANPFVYLPSQLFVTLITFLIICLANIIVINGLFKLINKAYQIKSIDNYKNITLISIVVLQFGYFFYNVSYLLAIPKTIWTFVILALLSISIFLYSKKCLKIINIFLLVTITVGLFQYAQAIVSDMKEAKIVNHFNSNDEFKDVKFKKKPNIYYFYMESYTGQDALKSLFNFDNSKFNNALEKDGFYIFPHAYSNYEYTIPSLQSTFILRHHYHAIDFKFFDAGLNVRNIFAGDKNNTLINVLRDNGYNINYYLSDTYLFKKPININRYNNEFDYNLFTKNLFKRFSNDAQKSNNKDYYKKLYSEVDYISKSSKPEFLFIKIGDNKDFPLNHFVPYYECLTGEQKKNIIQSDFEKHSYKYFKEWDKKYLNDLVQENEKMEKILDYIVKKDPNAVIVVLGDHGSSRYLGVQKYNAQEYYKDFLPETKVTTKDIANSLFNVTFALRYPYDLIQKRPTVITNVNVFRYIFSELSKNPDLMKNEQRNISMTPSIQFIEEGNILNQVQSVPNLWERAHINILGLKISHKTLRKDL